MERLNRRSFLSAAALLPPLGASGCGSVGAMRLNRDQLDYGELLAESSKRQTLTNIIRLRFGEPSSFLAISQIVSGYQLQGALGASLNPYPWAAPSTNWGLSAGLQYSARPTFTLSPLTGENFVESYVRPFSPATVVPLIQGGVPVDLLLHLIAQSIGPMQNTHPLGGWNRSGSPEFQELLTALRMMQEGGALRVRTQRGRPGQQDRVYLIIGTRGIPSLRATADRVYQLLGLESGVEQIEVVYGELAEGPRSRAIPVLTRSLLNVLYAVAAEVELPEEAVRSGRAPPTLREPGQQRPSILVRHGPSEPASSYVAARVGGVWYWVDDTDYESKLAFTVLELLRSVAEGARGPAPPVLTIPAG